MSYARPTMSSFGKENTTSLTVTSSRRGSHTTTATAAVPLGETRRNKWPNNSAQQTASVTTSKIGATTTSSSNRNGWPSGGGNCWKDATTPSLHHHAPPSRSPDPAPTPYRIERSQSHTRPEPSRLKTTDSVSVSMGRHYHEMDATLQPIQLHPSSSSSYQSLLPMEVPLAHHSLSIDDCNDMEEDHCGERTTPTRLNLMLAHGNITSTIGGIWGRVCDGNTPAQTTTTTSSLDSILAHEEGNPKDESARCASFHLPSVPSVPSSMAPSHSSARVSEVTDRAASAQSKLAAPPTTATSSHTHPANTLRDYSATASSTKTMVRRLSATTAAPTASSSARTSRTLSSTPSTVMSPVRATRPPTAAHTTTSRDNAHSKSDKLVGHHHDPKHTPTSTTIKEMPLHDHQTMEELYLVCPICGEGEGRRGAPSIVAPRIKEGSLPDAGEQTMLIGIEMARGAVSELVQHTSECLAQRSLGEKHLSRCLSIPPALRTPHTGTASYQLLLHDPLHLQDYYHAGDGKEDGGCLYYTPAAGSCWWSVVTGNGSAKMADVQLQVRRLHNELTRLASSVSVGPLHDNEQIQSSDSGMSELESQLTARLDSLRSRRIGAAQSATSFSSSALPSSSTIQLHPSQLSIEGIRDYNAVASRHIHPTLRVQCCGVSGEATSHGSVGDRAAAHHAVPWGTTLHASSSSAFATHALLCWVITLDVMVLHPGNTSPHQHPVLMRFAAPLSDIHAWAAHQAATKRISRFALLLGNNGPLAAAVAPPPKAKSLPVEDITLQHLVDFVAWAVVQKPKQQQKDVMTMTKHKHVAPERHPTPAQKQMAVMLSTGDASPPLHIVPGRCRHLDDEPHPTPSSTDSTIPSYVTPVNPPTWSHMLPDDVTDERLCTLPLPLKSTKIVDAGCTSYLVIV